ncbi:MAG: AraC family transcriptional regulator [Parachlamydiaceae bacterium]|nr:MAG: AraC family transcriptional regulator [Parachlamydiaceae bacterium]
MKKCMTCGSCGMPLLKSEDYAKGDLNSEVCRYCVDQDGSMKSYEEILQGTAAHFMKTQGITKTAANVMAKQLMETLPYWTNS